VGGSVECARQVVEDVKPGGGDSGGMARRGLAGLILGDGLGMRWSPWACALVAGVLLLPADHEAASPSAAAAAARADQAASSAVGAPTSVSLESALAAAEAMTAIPSASQEFLGTYALPTPHHVRHSGLLRAHILARRAHILAREMRSPMDVLARTHDVGFIAEPLLSHHFLSDMCELARYDSRWSVDMAPWALALAHSCAGPLAFAAIANAMSQSADIVGAMLDVPSHDRFALDVNATDPVGTLQGDLNLPQVHITNLVRFSLPPQPPQPFARRWARLATFTRLVQRCSAQTLNQLHKDGHSTLHALIQYCCYPSAGSHSAEMMEMTRAMLARAEPDGDGLDLRQTSVLCPWFRAPNCLPTLCSAHQVVLWWNRCVDDPAVRELDVAFTAALERQRAFHDGLLPALGAALGHPTALCGDNHGLPILALLRLIAAFVSAPQA
jgi:hypothetical protein